MDQESAKRRKCGPRVKTGCITCRIRRVKCDEDKPNCQRCVSTGRKCDGYVIQHKNSNHSRSQFRATDGSLEVFRKPSIALSDPKEFVDSERSRQLFHFYCVQSAFDLSVYLNSGFWHDMILQYSQHHTVIRQAVVAFGSSHMHALSLNQIKHTPDNSLALEQARHYDKAIRSLREYMSSDDQPDAHVILMCCALLFSCENALGNRAAAWQHLENGLHILNAVTGQKAKKLLLSGNEVSSELELVASKNGSKLKAKTDKVVIDEELVYVFSRLDVQATLCKKSRKPMVNLAGMSQSAINESLTHATTFATATDAQRSLDYIHSRLAHFLSNAAAVAQSPDQTMTTPEPEWIESERTELHKLCGIWETCMYAYISNLSPTVRKNLQSRHAPKPTSSPDWHLAIQIQLMTLHHRCWWMLFRSYDNPSVYTISPNPRAAEILDICEFLEFALPLRPSAVYSTSETDIAWKMISEIGVTAPLFVLSTKCTDSMIRSRAIDQLRALRNHGDGMYHETFLDQVIEVVMHSIEAEHGGERRDSQSSVQESPSLSTLKDQLDSSLRKASLDRTSQISEDPSDEHDPGGLMGWSKPPSTVQ